MGTKISVGIGTWLGIIGVVAGAVIPFITPLADSLDPVGVSPAVYTWAGALLGACVIVGRMGQAIAHAVGGTPSEIDLAVDPMPTEPSDVSLKG